MTSRPPLSLRPRALRRVSSVIAVVLLAGTITGISALPAAAAGTGPYTPQSMITDRQAGPVGVAVDEQTNTLYVAEYMAGSVASIDDTTGTVKHLIPVGLYVWGVAIDRTQGLVFATLSDSGEVAVIDEATDTVLGEIAVGSIPHGIAVDESTGLVYVANTGDGTVSVIDESTAQVTATIAVGTAPEGVAADPTTGTVYVTDSTGFALTVIDEASASVTTTIPVVARASAVAVDTVRHVVYVASTDQGEVSVVDAKTGLVVHTTPGLGGWGGIGDGLAVDQTTGEVFLVTASGAELWAIDPDTYTMHAPISCGPIVGGFQWSFAGVAVDERSNTVFCADATASTITVVTEPVAITSPDPVQDLTAHVAFSHTFAARGSAPVSFAVGSGTLPAGLTLDAATGVLAGTPSATGDCSYAVTATDGDGDVVTQWYSQTVHPRVTRVSGGDRYETSVAVAALEYPSGASTVYIASGANYPDALSAGPVADADHAPVLLTSPSFLPASTAAEVTALAPSRIVVVGGTGAVSTAVTDKLRTIAPAAEITRVAGDDRFSTSRALVTSRFTSAPTIYVATGSNFPDALAAGGVAGSQSAPILLVNGAAPVVDPATASLLRSLGVHTIDIIGGPGAVSAGLAASLAAFGTVTRLSGSDRYATAEAVNAHGYSSATRVLLATGTNFPDALSATPWAGLTASPLLLATAWCVPQEALNEISALGATDVTLIGGVGVLGAGVASSTPC